MVVGSYGVIGKCGVGGYGVVGNCGTVGVWGMECRGAVVDVPRPSGSSVGRARCIFRQDGTLWSARALSGHLRGASEHTQQRRQDADGEKWRKGW